jgi:hypothetical protein
MPGVDIGETREILEKQTRSKQGPSQAEQHTGHHVTRVVHAERDPGSCDERREGQNDRSE